MNSNRKALVREGVKVKVHGYVRPADQFHKLAHWEKVVNEMLALQTKGMSVRGGKITTDPDKPVASERWRRLIDHHFGYLLENEAVQFGMSEKNVLDFIEDFVNHRIWSFRREYGSYFSDISKIKSLVIIDSLNGFFNLLDDRKASGKIINSFIMIYDFLQIL